MDSRTPCFQGSCFLIFHPRLNSTFCLLSLLQFAVTVFPFPAILTAVQYMTCALATLLFRPHGFHRA